MRPAHMMGFADATKTCIQKSLTLQGRASRSEYWFFFLFTFLLNIIAVVADVVVGAPISLVTWLLWPASFCVGIRRMHDLGKSGWWLLIGLIPILGFLIVLYWFVSEGEDETNFYGEVPTNTI